MKCKRFLAAFLSLSMLVSTWSLCVMAADDEGQPDQAIGLNESDPVNTTLGELQEGVLFSQDGLEGKQTIAFTAEKTAKYSLLVSNAQEYTVSMTDIYGTQVTPVKTQKTDVGSVFDLKLQAGKTYIFTLDALHYTYAGQSFSLYICKTIEQFQLGNFDVILKRYEDKRIPFTPKESGIYMISLKVDQLVDGTIYPSLSIEEDKLSIDYARSSDGGSQTAVAFLTAGVSYDVVVQCGGGYYDSFFPAHLNISKDLSSLNENQNQVSIESGATTKWYSFTPSKSGAYLFSSQGEYSPQMDIYTTSGTYSSSEPKGESNNFVHRELLRGGEKYFIRLTIPETYSEEVTFPVRIEELSAYGTGDHTIPAGLYEIVYCPFAAEKDGYYIISSGTDQVRLSSFLDNGYVPDYSNAHYISAGQILLLTYANDDENSDRVTISIQPVTVELDTAEDTTLTKHTDGNAYATFTPDKNGMYRFSVSCESGFDRVCLFDKSKRGEPMAKKNESDDHKSFSCYLTAGETYVLDVRLYSSSSEQVKVSVKSESIPTVHEGENKIAKDAPDRIFTFVPQESGFYEFYNYSCMSIDVREGGNQLYCGFSESAYNTYQIQAFEMTAGREYTVEMYLDWFSGDTFYLYISKVPELTETDTSISKLCEKEFALFTPSESKIYGFRCANGYVNSLRYLPTPDSIYYSSAESYYSNSTLWCSLEKDVTYVVSIEANFGHTSETYDLSIVTERELVTGKNENVLIENLHGYGAHYTYYSFTPEKSGVYSFRSENNGGLCASACLYEGVSGGALLGEGNGSYLDGNMTMTATLEAGVTYRLWMYTDQSEQDVTIDLIIEQLPAGKLEGYSLSLDGSIAVNLYLSLADYVVKSDTAVLKYTRPDGTVVDYKMVEASVKTVNNIDYYVFHLPIAAKEMTAALSARIVDEENGIESEQFVFTVLDYAETILREAYDSYGDVANQAYADAVPLVKALLNYGARAQTYFQYRIRHLANDNLYMSKEDRKLGSLSADSLPKYVESAATEQMPDGLTFEGSSLSLESENALTFYFKDATGKQLTFTTESGVEIESRISSGYTLVKVTGIPAHKLDKNVRLNVRVSGDDRTYFAVYSPFNYCYNVLSRDTTATRTEELKDLIKALYFYHQAAKDYIGET